MFTAPPAFFSFFTLVTGPRRSLSLNLSDTRVYEPQILARLGTTSISTSQQSAAHPARQHDLDDYDTCPSTSGKLVFLYGLVAEESNLIKIITLSTTEAQLHCQSISQSDCATYRMREAKPDLAGEGDEAFPQPYLTELIYKLVLEGQLPH